MCVQISTFANVWSQIKQIWIIFTHLKLCVSRCPNVGLMLAHRLRRWPNIRPTLGQHLVFAGLDQLAGGCLFNDRAYRHRNYLHCKNL